MNRRALLAAAPALLLAGCAAEDEEPAAPESETQRRGDAELIAQVLEVKLPAVAAYRTRFAPAGFAAIEREHVERLRAELADRAGTPPAAPPRRRPPLGRRAALEHLVAVEDTSLAVLIDVLPKLGDPALRELAASMLPVEAQQLSVLHGRLGRSRLTGAFVYGRRATA